jgi:hypothetical protein
LLVLREFAADNAAHGLAFAIPANDEAAVFAHAAAAGTNFHLEGSGSCWRRSGSSGLRSSGIIRIKWIESIRDTAFFKIVRRHLQLDLVPRQDAYAMDAHAACKSAKEHEILVLELFSRDADAELCVGIRFFYYPFEFDNVLRHRENRGSRAEGSYRGI